MQYYVVNEMIIMKACNNKNVFYINVRWLEKNMQLYLHEHMLIIGNRACGKDYHFFWL